MRDHHEGIISRDRFTQAQTEFAGRNAGRAPTRKLAPTGRSCYSAKYALTERLMCGECGTLYRRCVWFKRGQKFAVWRCASRIDYGTKYCHSSPPTIREELLQAAILSAINSVMSQRETLAGQIEESMRMELIPFPGGTVSISDIDRQLEELDGEFQALFAESKDGGFMRHAEKFKRISDDMAALKEQKAGLLEQMGRDDYAIITGDYGGIWDGSPRETYWLNWLGEKPLTSSEEIPLSSVSALRRGLHPLHPFLLSPSQTLCWFAAGPQGRPLIAAKPSKAGLPRKRGARE